MGKNEKIGSTLPLDYIRGLLIRQKARCAISGVALDPKNVNADHIAPLSRADLFPTMGKENVWLVHKKINAMKGTMSYDEFVAMARLVVEHHDNAKSLLEDIRAGKVQPCSKDGFDTWVSKNLADIANNDGLGTPN